jgi:DNA-directed RNA polymerase specialized sigma24 family protein
MAALMRLPARQRQVVALRLILDLDTGSTAEELGIAPGTVWLIWAVPSPRCARI